MQQVSPERFAGALTVWLENHVGREETHSHQGLQTAKLVTTCVLAVVSIHASFSP
jgi:hypothetical protein